MIKKTINFTDYNGVERSEDFYFNLTKAEMLQMEMSMNGGLTANLQRIIQTQDTAQIVAIFKDIIAKSYGEKSNDGRRFIKNQEVLDNFVETEAYSILYMELATDADKASEFINGLIPANV